MSDLLHKVLTDAPSNIALIKYMGKTNSDLNVPTNASFSWTLNPLKTRVMIEKVDSLKADQWQAPTENDFKESFKGFIKPSLSEKSQARFLNHFNYLKNQWGLTGFYQIRSANNFASDCGLASSASSFAALTRATHELSGKNLNVMDQAAESRKGSGSSCRSFLAPWCLWDVDGVKKIDLPYTKLDHGVVTLSDQIKRVSSSEAHKRVTTSDLFTGRVERAEKRLDLLLKSMLSEDWKKTFEIVWSEFWDMHVLFETSSPSFSYFLPQTFSVLQILRKYWEINNDGPLVTMDAGPNIHLLFRPDQLKCKTELLDQISNLKMMGESR